MLLGLFSFSPWNSPGQNTGVGSLSLLQRIFPPQESHQGLLHCRRILYQLNDQGSPHSLHNPAKERSIFPDEKTAAQRGKFTHPRPHSSACGQARWLQLAPGSGHAQVCGLIQAGCLDVTWKAC